jgi:hypothetical protein
MENERKKVLEMIADGTISPSEGARLLDALTSSGFGGDADRSSSKRRGGQSRLVMSAIGPMIQETVESMVKFGRKAEPADSSDVDEMEEVALAVEAGQSILVRGDMRMGKALSVEMAGSDDNRLTASVDDGSKVGLQTRGDNIVLSWTSGKLRIGVPDTADSVEVVTRGGGITSEGVRVPVDLKTMGGGISISRPGDAFVIKTMGGGLNVLLDSTWKGSSRGKTMGGGISVALEKDVEALINAVTLGGSISVEGDGARVLSSSEGRRGGSKMSVKFGSSDDPPELSVSTMGGGVVIRESAE